MGEYERWEGRYSAPEYIFGDGAELFPRRLQAAAARIGKALAIADGEGRNGVWLARARPRRDVDRLLPDRHRARRASWRRAPRRRAALEQADVHEWAYPDSAFDVVAEIFTQFSDPAQRRKKWDGHEARAEIRRAHDHPGLHAQAARIRHGRPEGAGPPLHARNAGAGVRRAGRTCGSAKRNSRCTRARRTAACRR